MELRWGHLFDMIIINNDTQRAYQQLLNEINSLEREPQWVPAHWLKQTQRQCCLQAKRINKDIGLDTNVTENSENTTLEIENIGGNRKPGMLKMLLEVTQVVLHLLFYFMNWKAIFGSRSKRRHVENSDSKVDGNIEFSNVFPKSYLDNRDCFVNGNKKRFLA